jgi:RNA polymerase subunit RPABC4/transcription elongation factor Spt4/cbb3-type cytochrome oxidase subunit 3
MPDLSGQLGSAFDSFLSSSVVQTLLTALVFYLFVVWLAAAFWAFRDMHERSENPILPYFAAGVIILFTPFLFFLGVVVYRVIRPSERLGEVYERNLAEEALLAEVEAIKTCRGCDRRVDPEWIVCPWCRARLNRVCPNCERLVGLDWTLCAWCGKDFERPAAVDHLVRQPAPIQQQPRPVEAIRPLSGRVDSGRANPPT